MACDENSHSVPIVNHSASDSQAPPPSSTCILMTCNSVASNSSDHSSKKKRSAANQSEFPSLSSRKQIQVKQMPIVQLRRRLCIRELYYARLALVSNLMCVLAVLSIILMIIENELTFDRVDNADTKVSWFLKLIITIITVILLGLIIFYHHLDITLYCYRNLIEDWRFELTTTKMLLIAAELLICAVHPMPRSYPQSDPEKINSNPITSASSSPNPYPLSYTAIDVGLGLPMFFRLYLFGRSIMLHSDVVRHVSLRSFGYLNHVSIDLVFLIKTFLEQWPTRILITFCTIMFLIGSWSLRASNYTDTREHISMPDAMWLFIITFTTVGYGDLYPSTYYGRCIAAIISLFGLLSSALIIAIIAQKLLLTREEKYVHSFVLDTQLTKKQRNQAANVIKFAMKTWYLKRLDKSTSMHYFRAQRKLFRSIHCHQQIKLQQRNLIDTCVGFTELMTLQRNTSAKTEETAEDIVTIKRDVMKIEERQKCMNRSINILQDTLNVLLDKVTK